MVDLLPNLTSPALIGLTLAAGLLVVVTDWRLSLAALLIVYAGVAVLVAPLVLADVVLVKMLVGLLVVGILTLTGYQLGFGRQRPTGQATEVVRPSLFQTPTNLPFRLTSAIMAATVASYLAAQAEYVLPGLDSAPAANSGAYFLLAFGLLNLGLTEEPMNAGIGLLVVLLGFELFYAAVEPSLAIMALLAGIEFSIALAVSYLSVVGHLRSDAAEMA
jgi:hypothetical protein